MEGECEILFDSKQKSGLRSKRKLPFIKKCFCFENDFSSKKKKSIVMEGECEILFDSKQKSGLGSKRKLPFIKKCFCFENDFSSKKKKSIVNGTYRKDSPLSHSNDYMTVNNVKFNATTPKLAKPCIVKLSPLDPKLCAIFEGSAAKNSLPKNFQNKNFNDDKKNNSLMHEESVDIQKKMKDKSSTSDLRKFLKPCSVVLEKICLNYFSKDLRINFPLPLCSAGWVKLKPCSVKLHRINTNEAKISKLDITEDIKPCNVKPQEITSDVLSVRDKKLDMNVTSFEETSSSKSLDLNVTFKEELPSAQSDCEEIYSCQNVTTNIFNQFQNISIEDYSQNMFEVNSLKSNGAMNVSEVCDTYPNELNSLKDEKFSVITKLTENDSNNSYTKKSEMTLPRLSPLYNSYSEKVFSSSKSFEILKEGTVLVGNSIKCNEPSSLKFAVKSYSRSNKDNGLQSQMPENIMNHCFHCSKSLPSLKSLYYHLCREKQKRGYPCKFCGKNFDLYGALKKHKKCHALRNSLSCSDTMKSRRPHKIIEKANNVLGLENKVDIKVFSSPSETIGKRINNIEKGLERKENNSFSKLKPKRLKTKFFLQSISDATTSSGCYSSGDSNFLHYVWNSDDSEADL